MTAILTQQEFKTFQRKVKALKEEEKKFETDIINLDEVLSCYHLGGNSDYLLQVVVSDISSYHVFITQKLANVENIATVQSSFVMKEIKEGKLPVF